MAGLRTRSARRHRTSASAAQASLIIGGVAVPVLIAGTATGKLADRYGAARVIGKALPYALLMPEHERGALTATTR